MYVYIYIYIYTNIYTLPEDFSHWKRICAWNKHVSGYPDCDCDAHLGQPRFKKSPDE